MNPILSVKNLEIEIKANKQSLVSPLSFQVNEGDCLAIVGESGSGKSITSLAIIGLLPKALELKCDAIVLGDLHLNQLTEKQFQKIRGKQISFIFQEPMTALNPSMKVGKQVEEMISQHQAIPSAEAKKKVITLFEKVRIPEPQLSIDKYPHQMSGGQRQRVMIAMALSTNPQLLIADEPTTALDVTVQAEILSLLRSLQDEFKMGIIFITHDLGVVKQVANKVLVMFKGKLMESGSVSDVLMNPQNNYTKGLIACKPPIDAKPHRLQTVSSILQGATEIKLESPEKIPIAEETLVSFESVNKWFENKGKRFQALNSISFTLKKGETLGLVGESGCGKSTLGRHLAGLILPDSGVIRFRGMDIHQNKGNLKKDIRQKIQLIFQDPFSSLNPRMRVGEAILEPILFHGIACKREAKIMVEEMLEKVGLSKTDFGKYPHEFSGGQRQRIGIARALVLKPELVICDESVSALDVSVQAQVLNLLNDLKDEFGLTYLFISHDLSVVKYMSDRMMVMRQGEIIESGLPNEIYANPQSSYTKELIDAIPLL